MPHRATTPLEYIEGLTDDRKEVFSQLRRTILENLPKGFEEVVCYGMIGYVVPKSIYPNGYHVDPNQPLPFINIASQKSHIAIYHSGIYSDEPLKNWFEKAYAERMTTKLDMGKSCIRFKNVNKIPFDLIAELTQKVTPEQFVEMYQKALENSPRKKNK